jgi:hypothetical protein
MTPGRRVKTTVQEAASTQGMECLNFTGLPVVMAAL